MKVAGLVARRYTLEAIVGHQFDLVLRWHCHILGNDLIEVILHKLEYEVKAVFLPDNLLKLDYVVVVELAQRFHFSKLHCFVP